MIQAHESEWRKVGGCLLVKTLGTRGLYYKHITIVNDDSRVVNQTVASLKSIIDDIG
jgi:hypothetical protein